MIKIENTDVLGWEHAIRGHTEYKVTKAGDVIGKRGKRMSGMVDKHGYREVCLSENGKGKHYLVHRLILSTFNPVENMERLDVNHIDGNKLNNELSNLEWCTRSENIKHSYKNGLQKVVTNPHGSYVVLTEDKLDIIRDLHYRGYPDWKIAKELKCSRGLVSRKIREMGIRNDKY